jgi:hypothetical protein
METPSGESSGNDYINWCRRYFDKDPRFTASDRYGIRVALVHQGRTTVDERGQYRSYSFVPPTGQDVHLTVRDFGADGKNLTIDVARLASETKRAIEVWFTDQEHARRANIGPNLALLARQARPKNRVRRESCGPCPQRAALEVWPGSTDRSGLAVQQLYYPSHHVPETAQGGSRAPRSSRRSARVAGAPRSAPRRAAHRWPRLR